MMSKKDYYKEFIENNVIRVIFGYKNEKEYTTILCSNSIEDEYKFLHKKF
ncbi:hypothetical protein G5X73_001732 [Campylobacter jejuni]|nr:hypothetical protein [Campylobacter jejuni]